CVGDSPDDEPLHIARRAPGLHRPAVRPALGAVHCRRPSLGSPDRRTLLRAAALLRARAHRRVRQRMSMLESAATTLLGSPHHDGSELYVVDAPEELGGEATVRLRTRTGEADRVLLR